MRQECMQHSEVSEGNALYNLVLMESKSRCQRDCVVLGRCTVERLDMCC